MPNLAASGHGATDFCSMLDAPFLRSVVKLMRSPPRYSGLLLLVSLFALGCRSTPMGPAWNAPLSFEAGEQIMAEAPANLMRGIEAVGGRLMITDQRLLFQPHSINIQGWQTEILFRDVTEVRPRR